MKERTNERKKLLSRYNLVTSRKEKVTNVLDTNNKHYSQSELMIKSESKMITINVSNSFNDVSTKNVIPHFGPALANLSVRWYEH